MENAAINIETLPLHSKTVFPHNDTEWESRKDEIYSMYILAAKTTKVVREEMAQSGFLASIQQYERRFRKWNWRKHESKSSYDAVHRTLKRKLLDSTETEVSINGCVVQRKKLMKAMNRRQANLYEQISEQLGLRTTPPEKLDSQEVVRRPDLSIEVKPSLMSTVNMAHIDSLPSLDFSKLVWSTIIRDIMSQLLLGDATAPVQIMTSITSQKFATSNELILPADRLGASWSLPTGLAPTGLASVPSWMFQLLALISNNHVQFESHGKDDKKLQEMLIVIFSRSEMVPFIRWLVKSRLPSALTMVQRLVTLAIFEDEIQLFDNLVKCGMDVHMKLSYHGERLTLLQVAIHRRTSHTLMRKILDAGVSAVSCGRQECEYIRKNNECCCCEWAPIYMLADERLGGVRYSTVLNNADDICVSCFNLRYAMEQLGSDAIKSILQRFPALSTRSYCTYLALNGPCFSDLQTALFMQKFDIARFLLQHGAPVKCDVSYDFDWWTSHGFDFYCLSSPLSLAIAGDQLDIAHDCLDAGADVNVCYFDMLEFDDKNRWAIHYDLSGSKWPTVATRSLRMHGTDVLERLSCMDEEMRSYLDRWELLERDALGLYYPLQAAVYKRKVDAVNLMLERGADLLPKLGLDPLRLAVAHRHHHIAAILVERARNNFQEHLILSSTIEGVSLAVHVAIEGDASVLQFLLDLGADVCNRAGSALTPLEAAIAYGSTSQCIRALLQHSVMRHLREGSYESLEASLITWIAIAARRNRSRLMLLLIHIHRNLAANFGINAVSKAFDLVPDLHDFLMEDMNTKSQFFSETRYCKFYYLSNFEQTRVRKAIDIDEHLKMLDQIFRAGDHYRHDWVAELFGDALLQGACRFASPAPVQYLLGMVRGFGGITWRSLFESSIKNFSVPGWKDIFNIVSKHDYISVELQLGYAAVYHLVDEIREEIHLKLTPKLSTDHEQSVLAECLHLLLEAGFSPDRRDSTSVSPLMVASASAEMLCAVDLLLRYGAAPSSCITWNDYEGIPKRPTTALGAACEASNIAAVRKLLVAGADVDGAANSKHETCLAISSYMGDQDIVLLLLASGSAINLPASGKGLARTPLQAACERGHLEVVKILINRGADVNVAAGENSGITALQGAAIKGHIQICQILVGCGAKISAPASPRQGRTAIDAAAEHGRLDVLQFLLDHYDGDEPLAKVYRAARHFARGAGHDGIVKLLDDHIIALGEDPFSYSTTSSDDDLEDDSNDESEQSDFDE